MNNLLDKKYYKTTILSLLFSSILLFYIFETFLNMKIWNSKNVSSMIWKQNDIVHIGILKYQSLCEDIRNKHSKMMPSSNQNSTSFCFFFNIKNNEIFRSTFHYIYSADIYLRIKVITKNYNEWSSAKIF